MLQTLDIDTGPAPDAAIIWLHGLGADAHDFEPIVPELLPRRERAWRFVFPNAPIRPVTINGGMRMRAWYDVKSFDRHAGEDEDGFRASAAGIGELIAREVARGIPTSRITLCGFSQGGAVSLYTALRYPEPLAAVLALSCYLPLQSRFAAERHVANARIPIFMAHGSADPVIAPALALQSRDFLLAAGCAVEWHEYPMAHAVCPPEIAAIRAFLIGHLAHTNVTKT